ncbi:NTP pyrophosphatase (non-canonical NTP hydrolase) [Lysinibacillus parviboronicapiens]|uniref:NTP pyrophosphatase (Non-canonical NTP hydrolase) n=1 Tax=Lysinibacillus parviboronicapiens TaxID=436516 RepID=A0ABV2PH37_9BACI
MQKYVKQFSEEKGFHVNTIHTRTLYLVTEVGELAKEILSISFHPTEGKVGLAKENIGLELCDVIYNVLDFANRLDIDWRRPIGKNMGK